METREDLAVDEVRELRHRVSEACGHNAALLVERYLRLQQHYADRLLEIDRQVELPKHAVDQLAENLITRIPGFVAEASL